MENYIFCAVHGKQLALKHFEITAYSFNKNQKNFHFRSFP